MNREELNEIVDQIIDTIGIENFVDDLTKAQSTKELHDNLEYIDNMRDLNLF